MATTPAVNPTTLQSEVSALAHKFLYAHLGVIVLLIGMMCAGGYLGVKSFDAQLARQEQKDAQYQTDRKAFLDTLNAHDADRAAQAQKISDLETQIAKRDSKPLPQPVQDGLKPGATTEQAKTALEGVYSDTPAMGTLSIGSDGKIAVTTAQAQQLTLTKVGLDTAKGDLADEKSISGLQKQSIFSLTNDLGQCKALNIKAEADIAGYKKLAVRSRWKKFMSGAEKVGVFMAGIYVGHKL